MIFVIWLVVVGAGSVLSIAIGLLFSTSLIFMMGEEVEALLLGDSYFRITIIESFF